MANTKKAKPSFTTISEWLADGHMATGYHLIENVAKESAKAIAFHAERFNAAANPYKTQMWLPRSQLLAVRNDHYSQAAHTLHLVPEWLLEKKRAEGFDI